MSQVTKCDNCGAFDSVENPVLRRHQTILIKGSGLTICVELPPRFNAKNAELCERCVAGLVSARFTELCGLLAPYQPARVPGFIQGGQIDEEPLSTDERLALSILSRRLLKA